MSELQSNKEWIKWGEIDPLFGVASWHDKNIDGANPWTNEAFYKLGESDWTDFKRKWEMYGVSNETCLEIGCGAGRITMQLATYFKQVHALDVSDKMIAYAKKHIENPSVVFHISKGIEIPLDDQSINSLFSAHVFQHLDSLTVAVEYFNEISRVIKPGGTLMIHLPVYKWPTVSRAFSTFQAVREQLSDVKALINRTLMGLGYVKPIMRCLNYPVDFFYDELPQLGFNDIEVSMFITKSNNALHPFVFARKSL